MSTSSIRLGLTRLENAFDTVFGERANPLRHLGGLAFFLFWVVVATGIYLYIYFETSPVRAFRSVEYLTHEQWFLGGVLRSLHRYAADSMVLITALHLLREFILGRYRAFRWFSWITGVPLLWFLFFSGVTGYWLVWDRLAEYVAITTTEWLDALGIFAEPIVRNYLDVSTVGERLFTLLVFLHIAIPLFLLALTWLHVARISRPQTTAPAPLMIGTVLALIVAAFIKPALSQGPADLDTTITTVALDWFYFGIYPLFDLWGYRPLWALLGFVTLLLLALPWLRYQRRAPVAVVDPPNCNGCSRCFDDCPYGAVVMQAHPDKPGHQLAVVNAELCGACGICAGACPSSTPFRSIADLVTGIDMPQSTVHVLRSDLEQTLATLTGEARVVVFGCDYGADVRALAGPGVATFSLICIGQLPPSFIDYALRDGRADGVLVTGCRDGDCHFRFGNTWMAQRIHGEREPHLRTRAARARVRVHWAGVADVEALKQVLESYRDALRAMPVPQSPVAARRVTHG